MSAKATSSPVPAVLPHRPASTADPDEPLVFATAGDGTPAGFPVATADPHLAIAGVTGSGLTVTCRVISLEAARRGITVRACCTKETDAHGLGSWPGITAASGAPGTAALISATSEDMMSRYSAMASGHIQAGNFPRILLVVDEYLSWSLLAREWWARARGETGPREWPAFGQLANLGHAARAARISLVIATRATSSPPWILQAAGTAATLGSQAGERRRRGTGSPPADRIPACAPGTGTILGPAISARVTMHWLPDPGRLGDTGNPLSGQERQLLLDMLPPGARWDGPGPRGSTGEQAGGR